MLNLGLVRCRAAWLGDTAAIAEYASAGGDVNARDRKGQTALQFAAGAGQPGLLASHWRLGLVALGLVAPVDTGVLPLSTAATWVGCLSAPDAAALAAPLPALQGTAARRWFSSCCSWAQTPPQRETAAAWLRCTELPLETMWGR